MKIVIIEFIDEFEAFLEFIQKKNYNLEDFVIIALEPRLQAYLKEKDISYRNTLPYFNNESHKKIIVETEKIMQFIRSNFKFTDNNGLKNCYETEFAHHIRLFLNHILKMLEILENLYREDNNCEIFASIDNKTDNGCMITDSERYIGVLSEDFTKKKNLKFTEFNENKFSDEIKIPSKKKIRNIEKLVALFMIFLLRRRKVIFVPLGGDLFKNLIAQIAEREKKIVFIGIDYMNGLLKLAAFNILSFLKTFSGSVPFHYYLLKADLFYEPNEKEQLHLLETMDTIMNPQDEHLFEYNGVNYKELIKKKINAGLRIHMLNMVSQSQNLKYLFGRFRKRMVMSFSSLGIMAVAGEISRKMGIKSLFVSHGAHPVPIDSYHEVEMSNLCRGFMLSDYTHVALSTPVQERHLHFFKQKYNWIENQELKTGPLVFTHLNGTDKSFCKRKLGISPDEIVLTHAITQKYRNSERYYFIETLDESFSSMSDIVNILDEINTAKLIIRIHPGFHLTNYEITTLLPESNRYIIHRDGPFSEVIAASDILISYSSTVIDEALINRIPVLLYDKWNRYNHFKTEPYDNPESPDIFPVCYVNNRGKLNEALHYMIGKTKMTQKKDIDVSKYCYNENYSENLYKFLKESI